MTQHFSGRALWQGRVCPPSAEVSWFTSWTLTSFATSWRQLTADSSVLLLSCADQRRAQHDKRTPACQAQLGGLLGVHPWAWGGRSSFVQCAPLQALIISCRLILRHWEDIFLGGGDGVALPFSKGEAGPDEVSHGIPGWRDA